MSRHRKDPLRPLAADERQELTRLSRSLSAPAAHVERSRALLAIADGASYTAAAHQIGRRESIERVLKRRALDGQHPHSPAEIGSWFEQMAQCWNEQPTPFVWNGKRRQRRCRPGGDQTHRLRGPWGRTPPPPPPKPANRATQKPTQ